MRAPVAVPPDRGLSPLGRLRLTAEILAAYGRVRLRLRRGDLPSALAAIRGEPCVTTDVQRPGTLGERLGHATTRTLAVLPTDSRCLMQSLVLCSLLTHRGIDSKLVLSARVGETFAAHAWVEHEGRALLEPGEPPFRRLAEL